MDCKSFLSLSRCPFAMVMGYFIFRKIVVQLRPDHQIKFTFKWYLQKFPSCDKITGMKILSKFFFRSLMNN